MAVEFVRLWHYVYWRSWKNARVKEFMTSLTWLAAHPPVASSHPWLSFDDILSECARENIGSSAEVCFRWTGIRTQCGVTPRGLNSWIMWIGCRQEGCMDQKNLSPHWGRCAVAREWSMLWKVRSFRCDFFLSSVILDFRSSCSLHVLCLVERQCQSSATVRV